MCLLPSARSQDEHTSYLEEHGGETNAFTAHEDTHYYFDVQWPYLHGALDRFAQFFVAPLFTESATERELAAVDSEFAKNVQSDAWRLQQLLKSAADPRHPWSRFNAGNRSTLSEGGAAPVASGPAAAGSAAAGPAAAGPAASGPAGSPHAAGSVRAALIDFHRAHYSANRMSLAVLGREDLDKLEALVVPRFVEVPNLDLPPPAWPHPPYPDEAMGRRFAVVPVKDHSFLTLTWAVPSIRDQYRSKPCRYVSHILGHEGVGSLLSLLKRRGWADELMAGETQSHSDFATFVVTITLTELGDAHVDEMVPLVFACLRMIATEQPPPRWVFDETGGVSRMRLRFLDAIDPSEAALHISQSLQQVPPKHALVASFLYDEWAPEQITALLALLTPPGMIMTHVSPMHKATAQMREPWFGTSYSVAPIDAALLDACVSPPHPEGLRWPDANEFVPTEFALVCEQEEAAEEAAGRKTAGGVTTSSPASAVDVTDATDADGSSVLATALAARGELTPPTLVHDAALCEVWHKVDRSFRRPKTNLYMDVVSPATCASAGAAMATALLFRLLSDELTEFAYPAEIAGLTYMVRRHTTGFYIVVEGHAHKLPLLLKRCSTKSQNTK